ncbi:MAG: hypothetical protein Q9216_002739 [Gyalolechia sp. 2 TL-2023]
MDIENNESRRGERVPGTETLLDHVDESQRILVPQPSDDPSDPLVYFLQPDNGTRGCRDLIDRSCIELEYLLEGIDDRIRNLGFFRARIWTLSPVVAGLLAQHGSWRNFWWLNVGLLGLTLVVSIFTFPETRWQRCPDTKALRQTLSNEKAKETTVEATKTPPPVELRTPSPEDEEKARTGILKGQPRKNQFYLYSIAPDPIRGLVQDFLAPFQLLAFPIVIFAALIVSWSASSFLMVNLTQAHAFSQEPYKYSAQKIGFFNLAVVAGQLLGMAAAGPIIDRISMRSTKRNHGVREAEMRLPAMIPFVLIMMLGNFIVGFGYDYSWDWKAIVIIGYSCAGIQVAGLPAIASTYAIDSYKPATGSIFVTITVVKNLWGYGLSKFVTEWSDADGFLAPIMTNMCLSVLWCLLGLLFWWKGKKLRYWTRHSKVHDGV